MSKFYWSVDFDNCNVGDNFSYEIEGWVLTESGKKSDSFCSGRYG